MSHTDRYRNIPLAGCFLFAVFTQDDARSQDSTTASPEEQTVLSAKVEKYFAAYRIKDLPAVLAEWSEKSPELVAYKQGLQRQFQTEDITIGAPAISQLTVEGERASLRVMAHQTAVNLKSKEKREERLARNFDFVKENGDWRVWRCAAAENDVAEALVRAGSDAERKTLLAQQKELATPALVRALLGQRSRLLFHANYSQALTAYRVALEVAQEIGDRPGVALALNRIGGIHNLQGNYAEALEHYRKALTLSEELGDKAQAAFALADIATVHRLQGDYARALEHYRTSLALTGEAGDQRGSLFTLSSIGHVHRLQGNYAQALEHYKKSFALSEAMGDKANMASNLSNIGLVHSLEGNYERALECYRRNLEQLAPSGHKPGLAVTLANIGTVYRLRGDYAQALEHHQQSLALNEEMGGKTGIADSLKETGDVHRLSGNHTQALEFAERAASVARQAGLVETLWAARLTAGVSYRALGQPAGARRALEEAIGVIETLRGQVAGGEQERERFFESRVTPYHAMVELLIEQGNTAEALTYAERARSRALLDVLHRGRTDITKAMTSQEHEQERKLNGLLASLNSQIYSETFRPQPDKARVAELEADLKKARLESEAFQTNLYAAHPELRAQRGDAPPLTLEEAKVLLPDTTTALLEFVVTENKSYLFVLTKQARVEVKVYKLKIGQKDLTRSVERLRSMLAASDNRFSRSALELYNLLLKPAAGQLRGKQRLVIVPDGPLWELPVHALQTSGGRYLIDDHSIFYTPSLTVLRETKARGRGTATSSAATLFALGNPSLGKETVTRVKAVLMDESLDPLPAAERQVKTLERIYGPANSRVYVGAEAREERFKSEAKTFRIVHLATHGVLNDRNPMYSHLLLAQTGHTGGEDGLLEARELIKMDLKAELAVLSACETARGRVGKGEGMIGLTWALFVAGVPTTVVSRWKVRSDSTAELMVEFHRNLKRQLAEQPGRYSVAASLRHAALKLKRNPRYQHPFHWAGFVVVGDGY